MNPEKKNAITNFTKTYIFCHNRKLISKLNDGSGDDADSSDIRGLPGCSGFEGNGWHNDWGLPVVKLGTQHSNVDLALNAFYHGSRTKCR